MVDLPEFLEVIRDQIHLVSIMPDGPTIGKHFGADIAAAEAWAREQNAAGKNIYYTVNIVREGVNKKPAKGDIVGIRFAHLDVDPPKDGGPWDADKKCNDLIASHYPPSCIVWSGNGWQAVWRLYDLYQITGSGMFNNGAYDPSFTLNLVQNLDSPLVENRPEYFYDLMEFLRDCRERVGGEHLEDAWLSDASRYALFANEDPALKRFGGFYSYSVEEGFSWRWRQMNNTHTRYLHWLLLGPFAPYHFEDSKVSVAA